ncbi:MAG: chromosomal replication initiator protein DnaA [Deltaproteobacteria bacterium]|nr:MAG: chromosomal replication initiator protein DnaA [Deltaproteobacteria bacterium]
MAWDKVKETLKQSMSESVYHLWIEPLRFEKFENGQFVLKTPDRFFSAYVKRSFGDKIERHLQDQGMPGVSLVLSEDVSRPESLSATEGEGPFSGRQMRLPNVPINNSRSKNLHPRYTFDQFMVGESNILAESACQAMASEDGRFAPCLYINSDTGLGKSHLTHAVAHKVFQDAPMTRLHYLTANQFAMEMINGIKARTMDDFKRKYQEQCDILLVEDVHTLKGKKKTQEELNDVINMLINSGKRVVLTAKNSPRELVDIDNEFRSRMASGLVATIMAPDLKTRLRIVRQKAAQQKLALDEDVLGFIAGRIKGDVRKIESAVLALRARAQLTGGVVDLDMVREVVESVAGMQADLNVTAICDLVCEQFKISSGDLFSKSRKKSVAIPRQMAMYLARKHTRETLADIGRVFHRDHSTVVHSIKVISDKILRDTSVSAQMEILNNKLTTR